MRIVLDVDDTDALAVKLAKLLERAKAAHTYDGVPPEVDLEGVCRQALADGAALTLASARAPNSIRGLGCGVTREYKEGERFDAVSCVEIGSEILSMVCSPADGPHWDVESITFGSLNVLGDVAGPVPLSELTHLTTKDLLSPFEGRRTKVDVRVYISLVCKTDGATFSGYRVYAYNEVHQDRIATRVEPVKSPEATLGTRCVKVERDLWSMTSMSRASSRVEHLVPDERAVEFCRGAEVWVVGYVLRSHYLMRPDNDPDYYTVKTETSLACPEIANRVENEKVRRSIVDREGRRAASGTGDDEHTVVCTLDAPYENAVPRGNQIGLYGSRPWNFMPALVPYIQPKPDGVMSAFMPVPEWEVRAPPACPTAQIETGETCTACGAKVEERSLFTGSFVGWALLQSPRF